MATIVTSAPRASQARSRKTRQLILSAAVRVLIASGIEGFTMLAVSQSAGVSVGSIYRRFGGKEQLLAAAQQEFISNFGEQLVEKLSRFDENAAPDPFERVGHAVAALVSTFRDNGAAMRVLLLLGVQDSGIYEQGSIASVDGGRDYALFLAPLSTEIVHEDPLRAIDFTYRIVYASCAHRLTQGEFLESELPLDWPALSDGLAASMAAYLLNAPGKKLT